MTKDKLKIIKTVTVYSTQNTWETYRDIVKLIKEKILNGGITITETNYSNEFDEKYNPYTDDRNWGTNLDRYTIEVDSTLKASISYFLCPRWSFSDGEQFKFELQFNLPDNMLELFRDFIERDFYSKCISLREIEVNLAEEKRIKEIGKELLKNLKDGN